MVIDKNSGVPASGFCDSFIQLDVTSEREEMRVAREADIVIPALENEDALASLGHWTHIEDIPYAFDPEAYSRRDRISCSSSWGFGLPSPGPRVGFQP